MRSLPAVLIALALVPLSAALTCKRAGKASGFPTIWKEQLLDPYFASLQTPETCAAGITHCLLFAAKLKLGSAVADVEESGCLPATLQCTATACVDHSETLEFEDGTKLTVAGKACCCNTDNCDPAKPAPVAVDVTLPDVAPKTTTAAAVPVTTTTTGAPKPANDTTTTAGSAAFGPTSLLLSLAAAAAMMGARL